MIGAIHWKVNTLKKLAPYSLEMILSFGTGGFLELLRGFRRLYHGFFVVAGSRSKPSLVRVDRVVVVVRVLVVSGRTSFSLMEEDPLSETTC